MSGPLRILMLEDSPLDAELIQCELRRKALVFEALRVDGEVEFRRALEEFKPDLVLSDATMPGFSGAAGLAIARERAPDVPVIFVSGTVGEDRAVELLKRGATDYVLKDNLTRLTTAVGRALREGELERERRKADERFRSIFENAVVGIWQVSPERRIIAANAAMARIFGYESPEELMASVGDTRQLYVNPAQQDEVYRKLEETGAVHDLELEMRRKDGRVVWTSKNVRAVRDESGEVAYYEAFHIDVTRRKELEAHLLRMQRLESIGTLASGVAHDLNNILAPIMMVAPLLRTDLATDRRDKIVETIETSARRGAEIVKQVLAFGRGLAGDRLPVNLAELAEEMVKIARETFPKGINIHSTAELGLWQISGNSTQLHQVLLNLCVNARDAMGERGTLSLRAINFAIDASYAAMLPEATPGRYVLLEVSDTGAGIPPEILDRIFDPFFTTKSIGEGTGLGLSTALGIVKDHGGFVRVQSSPDKGTAFGIYLPAIPLECPIFDDPGLSENSLKGAGELVLVVDDEAAIGITARSVLEQHGYRVLLAGDGTEALAVFAQNAGEIAAVVTDIMMPFMDGVALARALRKMAPALPIVASTGLGERARIAELNSMSISAIVQKPYSAETLLRTLRASLHRANSEL